MPLPFFRELRWSKNMVYSCRRALGRNEVYGESTPNCIGAWGRTV